DQSPEQRVSVLRARLGVRQNAAGIVIYVGCDEPRAEDRHESEQAIAHHSHADTAARAPLRKVMSGPAFHETLGRRLARHGARPRTLILKGRMSSRILLLCLFAGTFVAAPAFAW